MTKTSFQIIVRTIENHNVHLETVEGYIHTGFGMHKVTNYWIMTDLDSGTAVDICGLSSRNKCVEYLQAEEFQKRYKVNLLTEHYKRVVWLFNSLGGRGKC